MNRRLWNSYGNALRFAALLGALFGITAGGVLLRPPLVGALLGLVSGTTDFVAMMSVIAAFEVFVPRTATGRWLAGKPVLITVFVKASVYLAVLGVVIGGRLGPKVALLTVSPELAHRFTVQADTTLPRGLLMVVAAMVTVLLVMQRHAVNYFG